MTPRILEPLPELRTDRVRLRQSTPEDAGALGVLYGDPEVMRYLGQDPHTRVEQMREKLTRDLEAQRRGEAARWVLTRLGEERVLGYVALFSWSQRDRRAEVGYVLAPELWGRGVMREVLPALLRFGFTEMGLHRIEARVDPRNAASLRVLERCGFRREGLLREAVAIPGGYADTVLLALLEGEGHGR